MRGADFADELDVVAGPAMFWVAERDSPLQCGRTRPVEMLAEERIRLHRLLAQPTGRVVVLPMQL